MEIREFKITDKKRESNKKQKTFLLIGDELLEKLKANKFEIR